jgi:hypothetical protein
MGSKVDVKVEAEARAKKWRGKAGDPSAPIDPKRDGMFGKDAKRTLMIVQHDDGTVEQQWLAAAPDTTRCKSTIKSGPYAGNRCRKPRLLGADVCLSHGGSLVNVKKAAQLRILAATDLVTAKLVEVAVRDSTEDGDRIRAILALLDRAGIDGKQTVTIEVKPWQDALQALVGKQSKKAPKKGSAKTKRKRTVIDGQLADDD